MILFIYSGNKMKIINNWYKLKFEICVLSLQMQFLKYMYSCSLQTDRLHFIISSRTLIVYVILFSCQIFQGLFDVFKCFS